MEVRLADVDTTDPVAKKEILRPIHLAMHRKVRSRYWLQFGCEY
jgi:hypothetical protein